MALPGLRAGAEGASPPDADGGRLHFLPSFRQHHLQTFEALLDQLREQHEYEVEELSKQLEEERRRARQSRQQSSLPALPATQVVSVDDHPLGEETNGIHRQADGVGDPAWQTQVSGSSGATATSYGGEKERPEGKRPLTWLSTTFMLRELSSIGVTNGVESASLVPPPPPQKMDSSLADRVGAALFDSHRPNKMWSLLMLYAPSTSQKILALQATANNIVNSDPFESVTALVILLNAVLIGAASDLDANGTSGHIVSFTVFFAFCTVFFLFELMLRWVAEGAYVFLVSSPSRGWNFFDLIVAVADVVEFVLQRLNTDNKSTLAALRILRVLRIVLRITRPLRVLRIAGIVRELRMMVLSVVKSGMSLLWSLVLMCLIIYVFSIYFVQVATNARDNNSPPQHVDLLDDRFGSVLRTGYTLFLAVSGGISWVELCDPLIDVHWVNGFVFAFFIFFALYVVLNIVTGIFVEAALRAVHSDRDEVVEEEIKAEKERLGRLKEIFKGFDKSDGGTVTYDQFVHVLNHEETHGLMLGLGLEMNDARTMFKLIDIDSSGTITIDEFLVGCMRLRGNAKAIDMVTLMYEQQRLHESLSKYTGWARTQLQALDADLKNLHSHNRRSTRRITQRLATMEADTAMLNTSGTFNSTGGSQLPIQWAASV